jgi:hypothetical protein
MCLHATVLDSLNTPMKVRQERLGYVDPNTTMNYTHLVSEGPDAGGKVGRVLCPSLPKTETAQDVES